MSAHLITPFFFCVAEVGGVVFFIESGAMPPEFSKIDVTLYRYFYHSLNWE